jgi:N-sulfoglucosamine sulfohydrolase
MTKNNILLILQILLALGLHAEDGGAIADQPVAKPPAEEKRPNILVFTVDDMDADSPGFAGCPLPGITPAMDRLSKDSVWFRQAHVPAATCAPSRHSMITGLHPHRNGSYGFLQVPPQVPSLSGELRKAGYLTVSLGKNRDYLSFPWDAMPEVGGDRNWYGRRPQAFADEVRKAVRQAQAADRPFYIGCNTSDPHRPYPGSEQEREEIKNLRKDWPKAGDYPSVELFCTPDQVPLPPFLPDLPAVREEWAQYLTGVHRADQTLEAVLQVLREEGVDDNTIVVFFGDNGASFPAAKMQTLWQSTHTPLLVRWPGISPAENPDDMVSTMDLMPTLLEAAGLTPPPDLDGRSLVPLLRGESGKRRDRLHTSYNFFVPGQQCMPTRGLHTPSYTLVYNAWSDGTTPMQDCEPLSGLTWREAQAAAADDAKVAQWVERQTYRSRLELYDRQTDPYCTKDVAEDPRYAAVLKELKAEMETEMRRSKDGLLDSFLGKGPIPSSWTTFDGWDLKPRELK